MVISIKGAAPEPTCNCAHCRIRQLADALRLPARLDKAFRWYASLVVRARGCRAELETSCPCGDSNCRAAAQEVAAASSIPSAPTIGGKR